jgi:hypothetical protein
MQACFQQVQTTYKKVMSMYILCAIQSKEIPNLQGPSGKLDADSILINLEITGFPCRTLDYQVYGRQIIMNISCTNHSLSAQVHKPLVFHEPNTSDDKAEFILKPQLVYKDGTNVMGEKTS